MSVGERGDPFADSAPSRAARTFHGVTIANPHAWLAAIGDPNVTKWVEAQHQSAGDFLRQCTELAHAQQFLERNHRPVDPLWHARRGDRSFTLVRRPDLPYPLLCEHSDSGGSRVVLDPNAAGLVIDPYQVSVSPSGRHIALLLSRPGEVLGTLQVLDAATGVVLETSDFTTVMPFVAWHPTEQGYYYSLCRRLFEEHARRDGVYWHALGTPWADDRCVQEYHEGPGHIAYAVIPQGGDLLLLSTHQFSSGLSGVRLCRLDDAPPHAGQVTNATVLFEELESYNQFVGATNGVLYFHTCAGAANGKLVAIDVRAPARSAWRTVIPESELVLARPERFDGPPKSAVSTHGLLLTYVEHAHDTLWHFSLEGEHLWSVAPPTLSTIDGVFPSSGGFRIYTQSFLVPRILYAYLAANGELREFERVAIPDVNPRDYELQQVFFRAWDGSRVPMYVLHHAGLRRDGANPTLLYGYGGFSQSITPEYSPEIALWLSLGGVYALANIRGGGEYGERWHAAGSRLRKQTTFDDFYAAAEHLIAGGYTAAQHLVARGISNGGLLTAVCVNQRPDLFAAVVSEVPLTDLMWLSDTATGQAVAAEYGSAAESRELFEVLRGYSPLQNVRPAPRTPAQLVVVADQDRSAPPGQAYQYVAARQEAIRSSDTYAPVLLRIVHQEGHNDWPPHVTRRVLAEEIAFLWHFAKTGDAAKLRQFQNVRVPMRDGVELAANIWLPDGKGTYPAVLLRTPYGNDAAEFERLGLRAYAEAGYGVVFQSVRGRGQSQGQFGFFLVEGPDGHDSVEWVAAQSWCNGKVGMDGGSYLGTAQWLAARECPPHLVCMLPAVPAGDWFNEIPYMGGALQVDWAFSWLGTMAGLSFDFDVSGDRDLERFRPLIEAGRVLGAELPLYRDILRHPTLDDWWRRLYLDPKDFARINLPVFAVTGWFDGDQAGTMYYWRGIELHSTAAARAQLIVGPWEHRQCYLGGEEQIGELRCGPDSILPLRQLRLAFLDEHLRGIPRPPQPRVRLFVTGSNRWHDFECYPPLQVEPQPWFLQSGGRANTTCGDGRLSAEAPLGPPDRFIYDPAHPVPYKAGAQDHGELEQRQDVLVYTSAPLRNSLTAIGPVEALIHAASSAADTDFTAKLLDVDPDGRAISLTHVGGILRARYRMSFERPEPLVPEQSGLFRIRLSHMGHTFRPGHRIRLEVSSSCFPMADPNPNTGRDIATETECLTARQTIFHDAERPSQLVLPVWRGAGAEPAWNEMIGGE
ncbi:MAG: CocE/NonD family hydrolase [Steroidobacteraceae bacterium]